MRGIRGLALAGMTMVALALGVLGTRWAIDTLQTDVRQGHSEAQVRNQSTTNKIATLQTYLGKNPRDAERWAQLGAAFLQRVREDGDPANYVRAADALDQAIALDPDNFDAVLGMANLALARHAYERAITWAALGRSLNPANAAVYGILGDADLGRGNYGEAFAHYQTMVNTRPDLASYARVAHARKLMGDHAGAIQNMEMAVNAGAPQTEARSWALVQLGDLYFSDGQSETAQGHYRAALENWSGYPYALAGLGNVYAAQGDLERAIETYTSLIDRAPLPEFMIALGDIYAAQGNMPLAHRHYEMERELRKQFYAH